MTRTDSNAAALNEPSARLMYLVAAGERADDREFGPTIPEGYDACISCSRVFDAGDLWHAGGEGVPTCTRCVMQDDSHYKTMRVLLEQAVAVLDISSRTAAARSIVNQARNLLDGE